MKLITESVAKGELSALSLVESIEEYTEKRSISTVPDYDITEYDKCVLKEYFLEDTLDFSREYAVLFGADLEQYGLEFDGGLYDNLGEGRSLTYRVQEVSARRRLVTLRGRLKGTSLDISTDASAQLSIRAIETSAYLGLPLYEQLILEAYLLSEESNMGLSFFTYFSAIEAFIKDELDRVKETLFSELHLALEHLPIDEKVRIIGKVAFMTNDLNAVQMWGELQGAFRQCKSIRNNIAHGKSSGEVSDDDLDLCIACLLVLYGVTTKGARTFKEVRKRLKLG